MNFEGLTLFLDSLEGSLGIPGCDCSIYYNHENVYRHMSGFSDGRRTKKVSDNDLYFLYSATKVITCAAAMQLVENGTLSLDDEIYKYLPEFENMRVNTGNGIKDAENKITVKDLFTMRAGFTYNLDTEYIRKIKKDTNNTATTRQLLKGIAKENLLFEPGIHYNYSLCHDVLGGIIEVVSGKSLGEYLNQNIFQPLDMKDTTFKLTDANRHRMSAQYTYDIDSKNSKEMPVENPFIITPQYESGGAGLISSVNDYIVFADAMSNNGIAKNSYRLLEKESIDLMRKNHLNKILEQEFSVKCNKLGYSYGLGVRTLVDKEISGAKSPIGEFGWDGAAGAYVLLDSDNKLAVFYAQHIMGCTIAHSYIHPTIRDLTYECLEINC